MINIIIAVLILVAYIVTMCVVGKKIPDSLSQSVFFLPPGGAWLWTVVITVVSFLTVPTLIERSSENTQWMAFIAVFGLLLVAVCPLLPKKGTDDQTDTKSPTYKIHIAGAVICAIMSQLDIAFNQPWLLLFWVPWAMAFVWFTKDGKWRTLTFWAEMTCFANTFTFILT